MSVIDEIAAERRRQIEVEGWTQEHDDEHDCRELAEAAACYAKHYAGRQWVYGDDQYGPTYYQADEAPSDWPWDENWWKPKSPRGDLIRAAALLVAEIERMDREQPNT